MMRKLFERLNEGLNGLTRAFRVSVSKPKRVREAGVR